MDRLEHRDAHLEERDERTRPYISYARDRDRWKIAPFLFFSVTERVESFGEGARRRKAKSRNNGAERRPNGGGARDHTAVFHRRANWSYADREHNRGIRPRARTSERSGNERASVPRAKAASGGGSIIDRNKRVAGPGVRGAETFRNAVIRYRASLFRPGFERAVRDRDHSPARQDVGGRAQRLRAADEADGVWVPGGAGDTDDPQDTRQEAEEPHGGPRRRRRRIPAFVGREVSVFPQRRYTDASFLSAALVY